MTTTGNGQASESPSPITQKSTNNNKATFGKKRNVLPLMTQRVLSKENIVLCRVPIKQDQFSLSVNPTESVNNELNEQNTSYTNSKSNTHNILADLESDMTRRMALSPQIDKNMVLSTVSANSIALQNNDNFKHSIANSSIKDNYMQRTSISKLTQAVKNPYYQRGVINTTLQPERRQSQQTNLQSNNLQDMTQSFDTLIKTQMNSHLSKLIQKIEPKVSKNKFQAHSHKKNTGIINESSLARQVFQDNKNSKKTSLYGHTIKTLSSHQFSPKNHSNYQNALRSASAFKRETQFFPTLTKHSVSINHEMISNNLNPEKLLKQKSEQPQIMKSRDSSAARSDQMHLKKKSSSTVNKVLMSAQRKANRLVTEYKEQSYLQGENQIKSISTNQFEQYKVISQDELNQDIQSQGETQQDRQEYTSFAFSKQVLIQILLYSIDSYPKFRMLSAGWYLSVNEAMDQYANVIENTFVQQYSQQLNFLKSYNNATPIYFCNKLGVRLDRIFQCEIAQSVPHNQSLRIGYLFSYERVKQQQAQTNGSLTTRRIVSKNEDQQEEQEMQYHCEYRVDILKKGTSKVTWIHRSDDMPKPYCQNEIQVQPGDILEFALCLSNMSGLINTSSVKWDIPLLTQIPTHDKDALTYNRDLKLMSRQNDRKTKVHCDTNRICEVEDSVNEWIKVGPLLRDQPRMPIDISLYEKRYFKLISVFFNELDQHFNKIVLQAVKKGTLPELYFGPSLSVQIKSQDENIVNEVKKRGVIFDRNKTKEHIEIRVGDTLVIYNSIKIPEELQPEIAMPMSQYTSRTSQQSNV